MYHAPKVGSVEPLAIASLWFVFDCSIAWIAALQVGTRIERCLVKVVERLQVVGEIERPGYIELIDRRAVVQQLQQLDLCRAQVDDRRLDLRLILHAQQFDAVQIDLCQVAGLEAVAG